MIARSLPDNLADVAQTLRRERDDLHDRGTSTEGIDWRPRIRELLDDSQNAREGLPR